jgi:glycosyltransferase involved in cell wall biosynthesis
VPVEICHPYPKEIEPGDVKRKNYGLYVGRLDPDKNIKRIVKFGLQCPFFEKFIVVGSGSCEGWLIKNSRRYKKLVFLGRRDNVQDYYSECKFLVHLPDKDPHPCVTMEAAQCGCFPLISEGVGSGYLFDKRFIVENSSDFNEVNRKIKYILDNENESRKLLNKSLKMIPSKEESLISFRDAFQKMVSEVRQR